MSTGPPDWDPILRRLGTLQQQLSELARAAPAVSTELRQVREGMASVERLVVGAVQSVQHARSEPDSREQVLLRRPILYVR